MHMLSSYDVQTVVPYTRTKYTKSSNELLECVFSAEHNYVSSDGRQWVCIICDGALKRGNMPLQAKATMSNTYSALWFELV